MRNVKTKLMSLALAALLLAGLTACGGGESSTPVSEPSQASSASSAASETEKSTYPLSEEKITLKAYLPDWGWDQEELDSRSFIQKYEDLTNVHVEWQIQPEWAQAVQLAVSSDTLPDFLFLGSGVSKSDLLKYGDAGYFLDLAQNMDKLPNLARVMAVYPSENAKVYTSTDGKLYAFPTYTFTYSGFGQMGISYYIDMAEELGYSEEKGNLPTTVDELYDMMAAAQEKFGADNPDFYAARTQWGGVAMSTKSIFTAFGPLNNFSGFDTGDGKTVEYVRTSDQYRHYVSFLRKCYANGLFDPNCFSSDQTANVAAVKSRNSIVTDVELYNFSMDDFADQGKWNVGVLPPLTSEYYNTPHTSYAGVGAASNTAINPKSEYLDIVITWLDGLYADEEHPLADGLWGISAWLGQQGVDWEYADEAKTTYRMLGDGDSQTGFSSGLSIVWQKVIAPDEGTYTQYQYQTANKKTFDTVQVDVAFNVNNLTLTDEESEIVSTYLADINSTASGANVKFVTGESGYDIDNDDDWNAYVKQITDMHLNEVLGAYQAAYSRYLEEAAALSK